jgi:hypothetical protein
VQCDGYAAYKAITGKVALLVAARAERDEALAQNEVRYIERLRSKTRGLVRRHRKAIEIVAKALLEHRSLSARAIDKLIRELVALPPRVDQQKLTPERQFERRYVKSIAWMKKRSVVMTTKDGTRILAHPHRVRRRRKALSTAQVEEA